MAGLGGKRPGAGRPKRQFVAKSIDVAAQVLDEVDAPSKWKALLNCGESKVIKDVMIYLTNRVHGCPAQRVEGGDKAISVTLNWGSTPEWIKK